MDIGMILKGIGIAKDFLGGDSATQSGPSALDIHNSRGGRFDAYKVGTDTYGNRVTSTSGTSSTNTADILQRHTKILG